MKQFLIAAIMAFGLAIPVQAEAGTFYLVRHAEKQKDGTRDPSLTSDGVARAGTLAAQLKDVAFTKILSTNTKRTRMTASLVAAQAGLEINLCGKCFPDDMPALAESLKEAGGTVLVVGHSNTTPMLAAALTGQHVDELKDHQYDRVYVVLVSENGNTSLIRQYTQPLTP